jgi:hypothetical protein
LLEPVCKIGKEENRGKSNHGSEVRSSFFGARRNAPELLETIDKSFNDISLSVVLLVEGTSALFITTPSDGATDMVTMEIASQGSAGVAFVGHQALGS